MTFPKAVCGGGKVSVPALEDLLLKARPHYCSQPHNYELFLHIVPYIPYVIRDRGFPQIIVVIHLRVAGLAK